MGFATFYFWAAFCCFFALYWTLLQGVNRIRWRNIIVLLVSYAFYASWDWRFLGLLFCSSAVDFLVGLRLENAREKRVRRLLIGTSLAVNLGFLLIFKYHNFFIDSARLALSAIGVDSSLKHLDWVLPVGISFYTFQTLSYTLDISRGRMQAERDPVVFFAYVSFFPQLIAGPIERASRLIPQFKSSHSFDAKASKKAVLRILWGLFKKLVIADRLAIFVNAAYADPSSLNGVSASLVVVFFVVQLYCDFSGFCDIAIGVARLLGFHLSENFKRPFFAKTIQMVYQRWHITIHQWFRDYLYRALPRGNSRVTKNINLLIVFAIAGIWHGSTINFLLWGVITGFLILTLDRYVISPAADSQFSALAFMARVLLHLPVYCSLVFFRSESFETAIIVFGSLSDWRIVTAGWGGFFGIGGTLYYLEQFGLHRGELFVGALSFGVLILVEYLQERRHAWVESFFHSHGLYRWIAAFTLALTILFFGFYAGRQGAAPMKRLANPQGQEFLYENF